EFEAGDENLYRYVFNSPQNATDPTGEHSVLDYVLVVVIGAELGVVLGLTATVVLFGPITILSLYMVDVIEQKNETIKKQHEQLKEVCSQSPYCRVK
ncbi:MAG: hypothetical protein AAGI63_04675, partial [Planctomycetota bacterium]